MNRLPDMDQRDQDGDIEPDDETTFPCACGDEHCRGYYGDAANINICGTFYAADCVMANHHPYVIASRQRDPFNERRR